MLNSFLYLQEDLEQDNDHFSDLEQDNGHFSVLDQRKSGILSVKIVHNVNGTERQRRRW